MDVKIAIIVPKSQIKPHLSIKVVSGNIGGGGHNLEQYINIFSPPLKPISATMTTQTLTPNKVSKKS